MEESKTSGFIGRIKKAWNKRDGRWKSRSKFDRSYPFQDILYLNLNACFRSNTRPFSTTSNSDNNNKIQDVSDKITPYSLLAKIGIWNWVSANCQVWPSNISSLPNNCQDNLFFSTDLGQNDLDLEWHIIWL